MLNEGQKWFFHGDNSTYNSYVIVRKIERNEQGLEIVHVSIRNIDKEGELWNINHLPLERSVLMRSLKSQASVNLNQDDNEFDKAYALWKEDNGGVWNMDLIDVIKTTLRNIES